MRRRKSLTASAKTSACAAIPSAPFYRCVYFVCFHSHDECLYVLAKPDSALYLVTCLLCSSVLLLEALRLRIQDFDFKNSLITVCDTRFNYDCLTCLLDNQEFLRRLHTHLGQIPVSTSVRTVVMPYSGDDVNPHPPRSDLRLYEFHLDVFKSGQKICAIYISSSIRTSWHAGLEPAPTDSRMSFLKSSTVMSAIVVCAMFLSLNKCSIFISRILVSMVAAEHLASPAPTFNVYEGQRDGASGACRRQAVLTRPPYLFSPLQGALHRFRIIRFWGCMCGDHPV